MITLNCSIDVLSRNLQTIDALCFHNMISPALMLKKQFLKPFIIEVVKPYKIYTNDEVNIPLQNNRFINIYSEKEDFVIVDAFDKREGISMKEAKKNPKDTAIVNFFCCEKKIPTKRNLKKICDEIYSYGFKNISLGGSMMFFYDFFGYDEVRFGEAFLTGYSTVFNKSITHLLNPFYFDAEIIKAEKDRVLIKEGFLNIGGFTNYKTISVNTDLTVIHTPYQYWEKGDIISLCPDYYTLIKLAHNGVFDNVEFV